MGIFSKWTFYSGSNIIKLPLRKKSSATCMCEIFLGFILTLGGKSKIHKLSPNRVLHL